MTIIKERANHASLLSRPMFLLSIQVFQLCVFHSNPIGITNPDFAHHLIKCNYTFTTWVTKDFIKLVMTTKIMVVAVTIVMVVVVMMMKVMTTTVVTIEDGGVWYVEVR